MCQCHGTGSTSSVPGMPMGAGRYLVLALVQASTLLPHAFETAHPATPPLPPEPCAFRAAVHAATTCMTHPHSLYATAWK